MKQNLLASVIFGWSVTLIGIIWPIAAYINPDQLAPRFMWEHIPNLFFISVLLLVLRYSVYGPILNTAKNAAKITVFALILQYITTGRAFDRFNPFIIGVVLTLVIIMAFQIMYLVFVCWYYLTKETLALLNSRSKSATRPYIIK